MARGPTHRWEPLALDEAVTVMRSFAGRWWISGGHALELFVGRSWRPHGDIDVGILRTDAALLADHLADWDIQVASRGRLQPWDGRPLEAERDENNLWCRRRGHQAWQLDVTLNAGDRARWIHRRDPSFRLPWHRALKSTEDGVPYLSPELQLLFKARDPRAKDHLDAEAVLPHLTTEMRRRLRAQLPEGHPWAEGAR